MGVSALLAGVATFAVLAMEVHGFRRLEAVITGLVGVVVLAFGVELLASKPPPGAVAAGALEPHLPGGAALLAVSIVGATVMPHVIYLHSSLTSSRVVGTGAGDRRRIFRFEIVDVLAAMGVAGLINLAMLATAAAVFHGRGLSSAGGDLGVVFAGLNSYVGAHAGTVFGVALLVSGIASSCVGTMSGQIVMAGFLSRQVPVFLRRFITMVPGARADRRRVQRDARAGAEPGVPVVRHPVRADPAGRVHVQAVADGVAGEPAADDRRRCRGHRGDRRPERVPADHGLTTRSGSICP